MSKTYNAYIDGVLVKTDIVEIDEEITHLFDNLNVNEMYNFQFSTVENGVESELSEEFNEQPLIVLESFEMIIDGRAIGDDEDIFIGQTVTVEAMTEPSYLEEVDLVWSIAPKTAKVELNKQMDQMVKVVPKEAKPFTVVVTDNVTGIKGEAPISPKEDPTLLKSLSFEYKGNPVTGPISGVVGEKMEVSVVLNPTTAETELSWRPEEGEAGVNRTSATTANIVPVTEGKIRLNVIDLKTNVSSDLIINAEKAPVDATSLKLSVDEQYRKGDRDGKPLYEIEVGTSGIPFKVEVEPTEADTDIKVVSGGKPVKVQFDQQSGAGTLEGVTQGSVTLTATDTVTSKTSEVEIDVVKPKVDSFLVTKDGEQEQVVSVYTEVGDTFYLTVHPQPPHAEYNFTYEVSGVIKSSEEGTKSTYTSMRADPNGYINIVETLSGLSKRIPVAVH